MKTTKHSRSRKGRLLGWGLMSASLATVVTGLSSTPARADTDAIDVADTHTAIVQEVTNTAPDAIARWNVTTVQVYVDPTARHNGWRIARAIRAWQPALAETNITLQRTSTPCTACITYRQVTTVPGYTSTAATTFWEIDPTTKVMLNCPIVLGSDHAPRDYRPVVAAHELGHCLGLPHWEPADATHTIMTAERIARTYRNGVGGPTDYDLEWVRQNYTVRVH